MSRLLPLAVLAVGCGPAEPPAVPVTPDGKAVAAASNRFALRFFAEHGKTPGSRFVSPLSLHTALGMTAAGANGPTLSELQAALHLPADPVASDAGYKNLLAAATGDRPGYQLRTANAVWGQVGYPWKPTFTGRLTAGFGASLKEADFRTDAEAERRRVNAWAADQTAGRIQDLLPAGSVDRLTRMVLANAVYFKGEWAEPFDPQQTRPAPFTRADGGKVDVPMMTREGGFRLFAERKPGEWEPEFWLAELPYTGGEAAMVLLVPGKPDGLPALEAKLTPEALDGWLAAAKPEGRAQLVVPKFKLETEYLESAAKPGPLHALGVRAAFDRDRADLSAMHSGSEQLYVSLVA